MITKINIISGTVINIYDSDDTILNQFDISSTITCVNNDLFRFISSDRFNTIDIKVSDLVDVLINNISIDITGKTSYNIHSDILASNVMN